MIDTGEPMSMALAMPHGFGSITQPHDRRDHLPLMDMTSFLEKRSAWQQEIEKNMTTRGGTIQTHYLAVVLIPALNNLITHCLPMATLIYRLLFISVTRDGVTFVAT
jgi:hypothetical protein